PREDGIRGTAYVDLINSGRLPGGARSPTPAPPSPPAARISYTWLIVTRVANSFTGSLARTYDGHRGIDI
ncbi:hypothetical protein ACLESD_54185, partial [Pyxidicoccus sp. 3LFB2]